MPSALDLLTASPGPLRIDQLRQMPMLERLITACATARSEHDAVKGVLVALNNWRESLELDFDDWEALQAACATVTSRIWIRTNNARVLDAAQTRVV
jgi:hypothetical protein